jgi:hypothetical protein
MIKFEFDPSKFDKCTFGYTPIRKIPYSARKRVSLIYGTWVFYLFIYFILSDTDTKHILY